MEILSLLIPILPLVINIACLVAKKGKILSLIFTFCGLLYALFFLMLNSGYGIGFGNPWIGVDWTFTVCFVLYIAALLATHAFVPSSGTVKTISVIFIILAVLGTLAIVVSQIIDTIHH